MPMIATTTRSSTSVKPAFACSTAFSTVLFSILFLPLACGLPAQTRQSVVCDGADAVTWTPARRRAKARYREPPNIALSKLKNTNTGRKPVSFMHTSPNCSAADLAFVMNAVWTPLCSSTTCE